MLIVSIRPVYSASESLLLTQAGMGPSGSEKRELPYVRSGSTHTVGVEAGKWEADEPMAKGKTVRW